MTEIDVFYKDELATRCVQLDNGAEIFTDAPKDNHGRGEAFSPTDLFTASLGSCVLTIMAIYARKWGIDLAGARIHVTKEMVTGAGRRIGRLRLVFTCPATPSQEIKERLEQAAVDCPVHRSIHPDIEQIFLFEWGKR